MSRWRTLYWLAVIVGLLGIRPGPTEAAPLRSYSQAEMLSHEWQSAAVHYPVSTDAVSALPPYVPESPIVRGRIKLAPGRSAAIWIDALSSIRVRTHDPDTRAKPRFFRVARRQVGEQGWARILVEEPGLRVDDNSWYLQQLPGKGAPWIISADEALEVYIESAQPRSGRLVWEHVEDEVIRWIRRDLPRRDGSAASDLTPPPTIPGVAGSSSVVNRLASDAFIAERALTLDPDSKDLRKALQDWRIARSIEAISAIRPLVRPYFATKRLESRVLSTLADARIYPDPDELRWKRLPDEGAWSFDATGPGVLEVDLRAIYPAEDAEVPAQLEDTSDDSRHQYAQLIREDGQRLASSLDSGTPTLVRSEGSDEVFPQRENLRLDTGERVGHKRSLRVRLAPGKHSYILRHVGGPALVRIREARRLQRLARGLRGESVPAALRRLDRVVARYPGPAAALLRELFATLAPLRQAKDPYLAFAPATDPVLDLSVELLRLRHRALDINSAATVEIDEARALASRISALASELPDATRWWLRSLLAESLRESGRSQWLYLVLGDPGARASPFALATIAAYAPGPDAKLPAWSIAGLRAAASASPLNEEIRVLFNETWAERTKWARLDPELTRPVEPWSWLDLAPDPRAPAEPYEAGVLWRVEAGQEIPVDAPRSAFDPDRAALLRAHVSGPPGVVHFKLDERTFHSLSSADLETFEIATTPGSHHLRVDGPPGTHAYLELAPTEGELTQRARRTQMWPAELGDQALRYKLEGSPTPGVLRIDLRVVHDDEAQEPIDPRARIGVQIVPDIGPPIRLFLRPGDPEARDEQGLPRGGLPLKAPGPGGPRLSVRIPTPTLAREISIVPDEGAPTLAVSVSIRRDATVPEASDDPASVTSAKPVRTDSDEDALEAVHRLSRELLERPDDIAVRIERGHRLLDLGQVVWARQDLLWLEHAPQQATSAWRADIAQLAERLDSWSSPTHLDMHARRFVTPQLLAPPLAAVVGDDAARLEPFVALATRARRDGPSSALGDLIDRPVHDLDIRLALEARWLAAIGEWPEAAAAWARLLQHHGVWQAGLAAADAYVQQMDRPGEEQLFVGAGIAHGLVELMSPHVQSSTLRRLAAVSSRLSEGKLISQAERSQGMERLRTPSEAAVHTPNESVRRALMVPPWPHRGATILRPGRGSVLSTTLSAPTQLAADLWCQSLREDRPSREEDARVHWSVDGQTPSPLSLPANQSHSYATGPLDAGAHRLELRLDEQSSAQMCSVRFRYLPIGDSATLSFEASLKQPPVKTLRRTRWWSVSPNASTQVTVDGEVSLWLEARADLSDPAAAVRLRAQPLVGGEVIETRVTLDSIRDPLVSPGEQERPLAAGHGHVGVLLLLDEGPYTVEIVSDDGRALARLRVRHERKGAAPPRPQASHIGSLASPQLMTAPFAVDPFVPGRPINAASSYPPVGHRFGTLRSDLVVGSDDIADADDFRPRAFLSLSESYHRELWERYLWIAVGPDLRMRQSTEIGGGGSLSLIGANIPGGLRLKIGGSSLAQRSGWGMRGEFRVDRPVRIAGQLRLIPGLYAALRHQSIEASETQIVNGLRVKGTRLLHPQVYTQYVHEHPLVLRPELRLRWAPFQDQRGTIGANLVTNADVGSIDQVNLSAGWEGLIDLRTRYLPEYSVEYQASFRQADAHRAAAFVRHRVRLGLEWAVFGNDIGRLVVGISDTLYTSGPFGLRNIFSALLRYDLLLGRGLRDFAPSAIPFRSFHERKLWAPQ